MSNSVYNFHDEEKHNAKLEMLIKCEWWRVILVLLVRNEYWKVLVQESVVGCPQRATRQYHDNYISVPSVWNPKDTDRIKRPQSNNVSTITKSWICNKAFNDSWRSITWWIVIYHAIRTFNNSQSRINW